MMGTVDEIEGRRFFWLLCILMAVVVGGYIAAHTVFQPPQAALSPTLAGKVLRARQELSIAEKPSASTVLTATMAEIRTDVTALIEADPERLAPADIDEIYARLSSASSAIAADKGAEATAELDALRQRIQQPAPHGFFWSREPWRFLEVLLWGLAGVIASLLMTTARYMRNRSFFREGLYLHWAQLVTVPLMAIVIVLLLSLLQIQFTLGGENQVQLNLSDARVLAVVAFLIGLNPFMLWDYMRERSATFYGRGTASNPAGDSASTAPGDRSGS
jgi:hypothetical protein